MAQTLDLDDLMDLGLNYPAMLSRRPSSSLLLSSYERGHPPNIFTVDDRVRSEIRGVVCSVTVIPLRTWIPSLL